MATTYTLISSNVLTGSAASVTFSSIPSTYTDLVLRISSRTDYNNGANPYNPHNITFNSDSNTNYSQTYLYGGGTGGSQSSGNLSNYTKLFAFYSGEATGATANTFDNSEMYISNYTLTSTKPFSFNSANETNATGAYLAANAAQYRGSSAVSSIQITPNGGNFVSGSSFYLYGIKNS